MAKQRIMWNENKLDPSALRERSKFVGGAIGLGDTAMVPHITLLKKMVLPMGSMVEIELIYNT